MNFFPEDTGGHPRRSGVTLTDCMRQLGVFSLSRCCYTVMQLHVVTGWCVKCSLLRKAAS